MPDLDLHKLPKSIQAQHEGKSRLIFRVWPRAPNGEVIKPSPLRGKEAGNGLDLWGATLYDFYYVNRIPSVKNYITTSTGSRLAKWMRQNGELTAEDELAWADKEEDPKEIPVADMGELIRCRDTRVDMGLYDRFSSRKEVREKVEEKSKSSTSPDTPSSPAAEAKDRGGLIPQVNDRNDGAEKSTTPSASLDEPMQEDRTGDSSSEDATDEPAVSPLQHNEPMQVDGAGQKSHETGTNKPAMSSPKDDPFHPDNYPSPWPFIPCSNDDPPPRLQQRIPLHLLPQKLHVHDPWNRLSINEGDNDRDTPWLTKVTQGKDIVRTYSLSLSKEGTKTASESKEKAELGEIEEAARESVMNIFPDGEEGPTEEPLIKVVLPSRPRKRTHLEEAHLYIAPPAMGKGNHSYVYFAEWELPRDLFVQPELCRVCIEEDARKQVQVLKDQGKWEDLLKGLMEKPEVAQVSGENAPSGLDSSHALPNGTVGRITIKEHSLPHVTISMVDSNGPLSKHPRNTKDEKTADESTAEDGTVASTASHTMETGGIEADIEMDIVEEQRVEPGDEGGSEEPSADINDQGTRKGKRKRTLEQDEEDEEAVNEEGSREEESNEEIFTIQPPTVFRIASYSGPVVRIHSTVKWQDSWGTRCKHMNMSPGAVPRTATVSVVAKLSIEDDAHLERESKNYQKFPSHFFEHWNGYNVIPPLKDPVPIGHFARSSTGITHLMTRLTVNRLIII